MPETHLLDLPKQGDSKVSFIGPHLKQADSKPASFISAVARLYWMLVGNADLYLVALAIAQQDASARGPLMPRSGRPLRASFLVRYVDVTRLRGATASGEPASFGDWYRYAGRLFLVS